ncbi:MAG TPA: hypothetical protein VF116_00410 [Ktedonobacterales bacterium]
MLKRLVPLLTIAALTLALALAACGSANSPGPTNAPPGGTGDTNNGAAIIVNLTPNGFAQHKVTITEHQTVNFTNAPNGFERTLCLGTNGVCQTSAQGPSNLTSTGGMLVRPGASKDVEFNNEGTYHITSANQGTLNLTVTVQEQAGP